MLSDHLVEELNILGRACLATLLGSIKRVERGTLRGEERHSRGEELPRGWNSQGVELPGSGTRKEVELSVK